jgi:hypothetical protein
MYVINVVGWSNKRGETCSTHGKWCNKYKTLQFKFLKGRYHFENMVGDVIIMRLKEMDSRPTYVD